jgi:hypothetical protein
MSTSSSSLAAFLAWTPFDALRQCLSCLTWYTNWRETCSGHFKKLSRLGLLSCGF